MRTRWAASRQDNAQGFADFLGHGSEVQLVLPDRKTGNSDQEPVDDLRTLVSFVGEKRSSIFLVHPEESQMSAITDHKILAQADRVLVMLWNADETFERWLAHQGSHNLTGPDHQSEIVDPVVAQALRSVAGSRNPSHGIAHGYGKDYTVDALRKLLQAGYPINEPGLEAAGFAAGLRWREVKQLRVFADGLAAGRRFVTKRGGYVDDIVAIWEKQAAANASCLAGTASNVPAEETGL